MAYFSPENISHSVYHCLLSILRKGTTESVINIVIVIRVKHNSCRGKVEWLHTWHGTNVNVYDENENRTLNFSLFQTCLKMW